MTTPRTFHFVFGMKPQTEPFHLAYYLCLASCLEVNRPDRVILYYHFEPYGRYWELIREFEVLTGVPVLLNTSFNENEPIVCTPEHAIECFLRTDLDVLAIGDFLVDKSGAG